MSLVQEILYVFSNYPGGYRIIYDILYNGKSPNQSDESFERSIRYRDWLISELVGFDFEQIQKSVWFGPPLPKEFIEYLEEIDLLKYIRFLKATDEDLIWMNVYIHHDRMKCIHYADEI